MKFSEKYKNSVTATIDFTAGSAGGIACVLVGQPLDTLKVKMQTFPHLYKNSFICFKETLAKERFRGLYAGTVPALAANVAENSVLFCAYGICQNAVKLVTKKEGIQHFTPFENAMAGCMAAFFSSFSLCPTELIKCRLQAMRETGAANSHIKKAIGPLSLTKQILKQDGILGLYRGFWATVAREMPGYFFFFGGYELSREFLTPVGKTKDNIGIFRTTLAGGIGGILFWLVIFPADVLKSRLQISDVKTSLLACAKEIVQKEGFRTLYKGLGPTLLRTFPATGLLFVTFEYTKRFLHWLSGCPRDVQTK